MADSEILRAVDNLVKILIKIIITNLVVYAYEFSSKKFGSYRPMFYLALLSTGSD